jgi:hypothetical protein
MIDFRYHALSLVAVFLALGIGIVLGVTVGDELVSETDRNLREDLREDVIAARDDAEEQERLADLNEAALTELLPRFAPLALDAGGTGLVAVGDLPEDVEGAVEEALRLGGAGRYSTTVLRVPDDLDPLADALGMTFPVNTEGQAERLGRRVGRAIARGDVRRLRRALPDAFRGRYRVDLLRVVFYRDPLEEEDDLRAAFEDALAEALPRTVGAETMGTDPSQVPWYEDHVKASVDNVDRAAGKLALILALDLREARSSFGFKETADRPLPELSGP